MDNEKQQVEEVVIKKGLRDNFYSGINVSLKTMDSIIAVLVVIIFICMVIGVLYR